MVEGLELFRNHFRAYKDDYVLIGGVACELVLGSFGIAFRPTKDFDIVIVADNLTSGYGAALKDFIRDGGYKVYRRRSNNKPTFFRFIEPSSPDYPSVLELATKIPSETWSYDFAPLDIGDDNPSLSAILFKADYYDYICANTIEIEGIRTASIDALIPLKSLAYKNLCSIANPSEDTLIKIDKHHDDIYRIAEALPQRSIILPPIIAADLSWTFKSLQDKITPGNATAELRLELLEQIRTFFALGAVQK